MREQSCTTRKKKGEGDKTDISTQLVFFSDLTTSTQMHLASKNTLTWVQNAHQNASLVLQIRQVIRLTHTISGHEKRLGDTFRILVISTKHIHPGSVPTRCRTSTYHVSFTIP